MPREPRYFEPGVVYHLISRFVEKAYLITKPIERLFYLKLHRKALRRTDWRLLGFAIMSNHIHLAAVAGRKSLDGWLRPVHSPFADLLNDAHQRIGPVFVRGPKAFPVPQPRVGHLLAYIHNNPVRAGVSPFAMESTWTSHRAYAGYDHAPWLNVSLGLSMSGLTAASFDEWVNHPEQRGDRSFSEVAHELELRQAEDTAVMTDAPDAIASAVVEAAAIIVGITPARARATTRGRGEVTVRAAAVHCSGRLGISERRIAAALNISQQRVNVLRRRAQSDDVLCVSARVYETLQEQVVEVVPRP